MSDTEISLIRNIKELKKEVKTLKSINANWFRVVTENNETIRILDDKYFKSLEINQRLLKNQFELLDDLDKLKKEMEIWRFSYKTNGTEIRDALKFYREMKKNENN